VHKQIRGEQDMLKGRIDNIWFSRIPEGEDLVEAIKKRAEENGIKVGVFILIGSLKQAVVGYFKKGEYYTIELEGPLEIASCMGNIAGDEKGQIIVHSHIVLSNQKGEALGGHLMKGSFVGATAELVIIEGTAVSLQRTFDEKTRLSLLNLD